MSRTISCLKTESESRTSAASGLRHTPSGSDRSLRQSRTSTSVNSEVEDLKETAGVVKNQELLFEVEDIVDHKFESGKIFFLIKWKGWEENQNTWEPQSSLSCPAILKKYLRSNKIETRSQVSSESTESEDYIVEQSGSLKKFKKMQAADEVEFIFDHKIEKGKKLYLVKWKGWPASDSSWEPESSLSCPAILKKYLKSGKVATSSGKYTESENDFDEQVSPKNTVNVNKYQESSKVCKVTNKRQAQLADMRATSCKEERMAIKSTKPSDWEVEEITGVKYNDDDTKEFLIRWKGCDATQDTWEPESNVDCPALISKFMFKINVN